MPQDSFYLNLDFEAANQYTQLDLEAEQEVAGGGFAEFGKGIVSSTIGVAKEVVIQGLTDIIAAPGEYLSFVLPEYEKAAPKEQRERLIAPLKTAKRRMTIAQKAFEKTHRGTAAWAGRALGEAVPYMATALAGGITIGPIGAGLVGFSIEGGQAYESAKKSGATEEQAQIERGIVGSINAVIEGIQIGRLMKFQTAGRHSIKGLVALAKKKAYGKMAKEGVKFSGRILKHSLEEGLEELLQEGVSFAVPANLRNEMPRRPDGSPDILAIASRFGAALAGGMFAGGILGGAGAVSIDMNIRQKVADLTKELTPDQKNEILGGMMDQAVEDDPTMTPEEKYSAKFILGNIRTNLEEELVSRLTTNEVKIGDQKTLQEVGEDIRKALGITEEVKKWKWSDAKVKARMGVHTTKAGGINEIKINGGHWAFFGADRQMELRRTIVHELGHMAAKPVIKPRFKTFPKSAKIKKRTDIPGYFVITYKNEQYNISANDIETAKQQFITFKGERRSIHHAEFKKWYDDNVGILIPEIKKTLGPVMEAHLEQEAAELVDFGLKEPGVPPTITETKIVAEKEVDYSRLDPTKEISIITEEGKETMTVEEAVYRLDELTAPEYYDGLVAEEAAIAQEEIREITKALNKLLPPAPVVTKPTPPTVTEEKEIRYAPIEDIRLLEQLRNNQIDFNKKRVSKKRQTEIIESSKQLRIDLRKRGYGSEYIKAVEMEDVGLPIGPAPTVTEAQAMPKKRSRKALLALGHKIPTQFGLTDDERRDFIEDITGKRSLKELDDAELLALIEQMESEMGTAVLGPEDYQKPIQVAGETTTTAAVMNGAAVDVEALPQRVEIPKRVTKRYAKKRERGRFRRLKEFLWGKENTPIYHLANILGPTFQDVFDKNMQQSLVTQAGHLRSVYTALREARTEQGITDTDLARMSHALNPRMQVVQAIQEMRGRGTEINAIEINGTTYDLTMADLIDIYLISGQEDGLRHLLGGGLVVNTVETGALSEDTISELNQIVENDPQAKFMADAILGIGENIWKNSINNVSQRMEGKDIAVVENWWGLEVYHPKRLGGKQERFNMNLIENRSIFKDRTKSSRPLVVRDAFSRFSVFENGIAEYVGFAESTRLARTVLNNADLSNALDQKGYGDIRDKMMTIMERAQSLPKQQGAFGKFMAEQLPGLYRAYLYFNPRVVMSQYTSVMNYGALVSGKYMSGIKDGLSAEAIRETLELSDIAFDRFYMAHSNLALGEAAKSDAVLRMFTHKAADINKAGITLRMADMGALAAGMKIAQAELKDAQAGKIEGESAIWWADKNVEVEEGSLEWRNAVTKRAEFLWQRSQPSWDKWNRSMTTSGLVRQVFFPFRTFHEKSLTILHEANLEYQRSGKSLDDRARQAKKYGAVLSSYTLNTILRALIMGLLARKAKKPLQYVSDLLEAPLSMFPILGTILKTSIGNFINVLIDERLEFHGEAIEAFPATMLNLIAQAPADFSIAAGYYLDGDTEKANRAFKRAIQKLYKGIGTSEGIPVSEMNRVYKGWIEGEEEPTPRGRRRVKRVRPRKVKARR